MLARATIRHPSPSSRRSPTNRPRADVLHKGAGIFSLPDAVPAKTRSSTMELSGEYLPLPGSPFVPSSRTRALEPLLPLERLRAAVDAIPLVDFSPGRPPPLDHARQKH